VKHYHWVTGRIVLEQKPIEGESRWCQHTYPMHFKTLVDGLCQRMISDILVTIVAGDQNF